MSDDPEILDQQAADGARLTPAANSLADFVLMLEDGQFDCDVANDLRDLAADMQADLQAGAQKVSAKLTITVDIDLEPTGNGPIFYLRAAHKIAQKQLKRQRSVAWTTEDNRFTPQQAAPGPVVRPAPRRERRRPPGARRLTPIRSTRRPS